eukprot:TRINITY_DN7549_c0_g1_i1.p1 TRINITY_DN7549_c0_g1~~TRINITY_DN7549_c0_g1_i1.p1  ORF type:complete len:681 (+),score=-49.09 TRINITY_DN7549_c0_g1_i1:140-2182(+)
MTTVPAGTQDSGASAVSQSDSVVEEEIENFTFVSSGTCLLSSEQSTATTLDKSQNHRHDVDVADEMVPQQAVKRSLNDVNSPELDGFEQTNEGFSDEEVQAETQKQNSSFGHNKSAGGEIPEKLMDIFCEVCNSGDNDAELILCDLCDCGYHTFCLHPVLKQVPEGSWVCPLCIPSSSDSTMMKIMKSLIAHKESGPFMHPVDVAELGLADYHTVVKVPMDFDTIRRRVAQNHYVDNPKQFEADVQLVFSNCRLYNDPASSIVAMANEVEAYFESLLKKHGNIESVLPPGESKGAPKQDGPKRRKTTSGVAVAVDTAESDDAAFSQTSPPDTFIENNKKDTSASRTSRLRRDKQLSAMTLAALPQQKRELVDSLLRAAFSQVHAYMKGKTAPTSVPMLSAQSAAISTAAKSSADSVSAPLLFAGALQGSISSQAYGSVGTAAAVNGRISNVQGQVSASGAPMALPTSGSSTMLNPQAVSALATPAELRKMVIHVDCPQRNQPVAAFRIFETSTLRPVLDTYCEQRKMAPKTAVFADFKGVIYDLDRPCKDLGIHNGSILRLFLPGLPSAPLPLSQAAVTPGRSQPNPQTYPAISVQGVATPRPMNPDWQVGTSAQVLPAGAASIPRPSSAGAVHAGALAPPPVQVGRGTFLTGTVSKPAQPTVLAFPHQSAVGDARMEGQ